MTASGFGQSLSGESGLGTGGSGFGTRGEGLGAVASVSRLTGWLTPFCADTMLEDAGVDDPVFDDASLDGLRGESTVISDRGQPAETMSVITKTAAAAIALFSMNHVRVGGDGGLAQRSSTTMYCTRI